jgi:hypothetical protein
VVLSVVTRRICGGAQEYEYSVVRWEFYCAPNTTISAISAVASVNILVKQLLYKFESQSLHLIPSFFSSPWISWKSNMTWITIADMSATTKKST